jgi:hypothetical protein
MAAKNEAIAKAGGGTPGKRLKATTTIKPKKKKKVKRLGR